MAHAIGTIVLLIVLIVDWSPLTKGDNKKTEGSVQTTSISSEVVQDSQKTSN